MSRVAILGGTFDPIHLGHLLIAEQAYNTFSLDKVIFMPAGAPPHKTEKKIVDGSRRLKMVKLAIRDNPHFSYSDYELKKEGRSYTADTLRYFKELNPGHKVYFIIGADSLLDIFSWREPDYLLENGHFIVARRPGYPLDNIHLDERYQPYLEHIHIMEGILIDISSSKIRERIRTGQSIRYQTRDAVISYIEKERLYRGD